MATKGRFILLKLKSQ